MRKLLAARPSPAMAVAFVALLAALSGTAIALPGTSSVDSGDVKNNSIRSKDVRNNNLRGKDVRNSSLAGADVKNDSLTGLDINEATLGKVPSAAAADSATTANSANTANSAASVDGLSFARINYRAPEGSGSQTILEFGGLTIAADCAAGPVLTATATSTVDNASILNLVATDGTSLDDDADADGANTNDNNRSADSEDDNFDSGQNVNLFPVSPLGNTTNDSAQGHVTFTSPDGRIVTVQYRAEADADSLGSTNTDCYIVGHAMLS